MVTSFSRVMWRLGHICSATVFTLLLLSGCRSFVLPPDTGLSRPFPLRDDTIPTVIDSTNTLGLGSVITYALGTSPRIHRFSARVGTAAGDLAKASTLESPEVRFGTGKSQRESRGWDAQTESGTSVRTGSEATTATEHGLEHGQSERSVYGVFEETSQSTQISQSDSAGSKTSRQESQFEAASQSQDGGNRAENGFTLGLRFSPPNPWERRAAISAAEAGQLTAQAELIDEEYRLVFDILEAAIRLAYQQRLVTLSGALVLECENVRANIEAPASQGFIPRTDYVDICLRTAAAQANTENLAASTAGLEQEFRRLAGVGPERVDLAWIKANAIYRPTSTNGFSETRDEHLERAWKRPDVLAAYWHLRRCQSESKESRARRYPWLSHVAASYSRWSSTSGYDRLFIKQRDESSWSSQFSTSQQETFQNKERWTSLGEYETGSSTEIENEVGRSAGTSSETGLSSGLAWGGEDSSGDEWWVEFGIEIPIFEWLSREETTRRQVALDAQRMFDATLARAREEIRLTSKALLSSRAEHVVALGRVPAEVKKLNELAAVSRTQGLTGELEALRIRERSIELTLRLMERGMGSALVELDFCRAAGIIPGQETYEDAPVRLGSVDQKRMAPETEAARLSKEARSVEKKANTTAAEKAKRVVAAANKNRPKVDPALLDLMQRQQARWSEQFKEIDRRALSDGSRRQE